MTRRTTAFFAALVLAACNNEEPPTATPVASVSAPIDSTSDVDAGTPATEAESKVMIDVTATPPVFHMNPAPNAPTFVQERNRNWVGWYAWRGDGKDFPGWARRFAWGTAMVAGKTAIWYAYSNSDALTSVAFNLLVPKSSLHSACHQPTYPCYAYFDKTGNYSESRRGMQYTTIYSPIKRGGGQIWLNNDANVEDWEGDGKKTVRALVAQIERDFPDIKLRVRQLLR